MAGGPFKKLKKGIMLKGVVGEKMQVKAGPIAKKKEQKEGGGWAVRGGKGGAVRGR